MKREVLAECDEFVVERVGLDAGCDFEALRDGETCEVWGVLSGSATLEAGRNGALRLGSVGFALLPAAIGRFRVRADEAVVALRAYLP